MKILKTIIVAAFAAILFLGNHVPAQAFFEFTVRDEIEMGKKFDMMVRKAVPLIEDPEITGYCDHVIRRIEKGMPPQPFPITVRVIKNSALNAFAVPGGYVYVFTGLLTQLQHESQLASVLSHELAHVSQRHVADRMERMKYTSIGSTLATLAGVFLGMSGGDFAPGLGSALMVGSQAGAKAAFLVYTQENEREADHVGMNYLLEAGYRPSAMPETFEIMQRERWNYGTSKLPSYLATHPGLNTRVGYLKERISRMPPSVTGRIDDDLSFDRVRSLVRARYADPEAAIGWYKKHESEMSCLDKLGYGICLARLKKKKEAEPHFKSALECGAHDSVILREAGRYYFEHGEYAEAEKLLRRAVEAGPNDSFALFFLGRVLGEEKKYTEGLEYMKKVLKNHPDDAEVHYFLGQMYGKSGDHFNGYLHLAYAQVYAGRMDKAEYHIKRLESTARTPSQKNALAELKKVAKKRFKKG